jgi:FdhE protein
VAAVSDTLIIAVLSVFSQVTAHYSKKPVVILQGACKTKVLRNNSMPYVITPPASREECLAAAQDRWGAILAARPDLEPAVALQRRLITRVVELTDTIDRGRLPRLSLPPKYLAAKLGRGVPALAGEPIPLPVQTLSRPLVQLCDDLAAGGAAEAADHIRAAIESGQIEAGSLLAASLSRDQDAIRQGAVHRGLAPDLVWLVAELAVSPFAHALQRAVFSRASSPATPVSALADACAHWEHGYCPACGSWPALAEVVGGHRTLRCSFCAAAWELSTYGCIYCGESGEAFVTAAPDEERKDRRVEVCSACASYLKAMDVAALSPFPLLAIADLETMDLDAAAMERGYSRPPLKQFSSRR